MVIHTLFTLIDTPDLYTMFDKPFDDKRSFIINSAYSVKHKDNKHIEFFLFSGRFQILNSISVACLHLETRHTFFLKFFQNGPTVAFCKFSARGFLHRNIVFVYLTFSRYSVQTIHSFHIITLSYNFCKPTILHIFKNIQQKSEINSTLNLCFHSLFKCI